MAKEQQQTSSKTTRRTPTTVVNRGKHSVGEVTGATVTRLEKAGSLESAKIARHIVKHES